MPESHYFSPTPAASNHPQDAPIRTRDLKVSVSGVRLAMRVGNGVFSKTELDDGSRLLLQTFLKTDTVSRRICDLGCGWGAVGCVLARARPESFVWMCDINGRAARFALDNARLNELQNAFAWQGDGLNAVRDAQFDAILCNPPVRAGNVVIQQLFDDAQRTLTAGGSLWIVLRTAQGAKSWAKKLEAQFGNCRTVTLLTGFRILHCVR